MSLALLCSEGQTFVVPRVPQKLDATAIHVVGTPHEYIMKKEFHLPHRSIELPPSTQLGDKNKSFGSFS
jgi:hypothetical protein